MRALLFSGWLLAALSPWTAPTTALAQPGPQSRAEAPAGDAPIETDRPGNGNAATTVPQWRFQIETSAGYALDRNDVADQHQLSFPTVFRLGLLPMLELRLGTAIVGIDADPPPDADTVHPTDTSVGAKVQALANEGAVPNLAFMVDVALPSGRGPFTADAVVPDMRAALSWGLPRGFGVLLNAGAQVPDDAATGRYANLLYVANLSYAPPVWGGRLALFVESFGLIPVESDLAAVVQVDWGAALRFGQNLQLDVFGQNGLTDAAVDFQIALGFSARI